MTIWFFGDSWPAGIELTQFRQPPEPPGSAPELAYPTLVGQFLEQPIKNLAQPGSSVPSMIEQIKTALPRFIKGDRAIFAITAKTRRFYRDSQGQGFEQQYTPDELLCNPHEDDRVCSQSLYLLYSLCQQLNVTPSFFNLFDNIVSAEPWYRQIPERSWIIEPGKSVISKWFDPEYFAQFSGHFHYGDYRTWLDSNSPAVKKYIRPCEAHPNLVGHRLIAEHIADFIELDQ